MDSGPGGDRDFPSTQWSRLVALREATGPERALGLEELAGSYWKPVYCYVRALRRVSVDEAGDLTQQFFALLLHRGDLEKLSPDRGRFRGFLKRALKNFLVDCDRARDARRPRGEARLIPIEPGDLERLEVEMAGEHDPGRAFDRAWAHGLLHRAIDRLGQELTAAGRTQHLEMFREYCLLPSGLPAGEGADQPSYAEMAERHACSIDDVRNRLRYARKRMREILTDLARETLGAEEDVEEELRHLLAT